MMSTGLRSGARRDACVDWATTETMIHEMRDTLRPNLSLRSAS